MAQDGIGADFRLIYREASSFKSHMIFQVELLLVANTCDNMFAGSWFGGPTLSILLCVQEMAGQFCLQIILGASCSYFVVGRLFVLQSQDVLPSASQVPNLGAYQ